jgi:hypothetical protein
MGLGTKTYWLIDRQSQCDFDFDLLCRKFPVSLESPDRYSSLVAESLVGAEYTKFLGVSTAKSGTEMFLLI